MVSRVRVWLNRTYAENVFFMDQLRRNPQRPRGRDPCHARRRRLPRPGRRRHRRPGARGPLPGRLRRVRPRPVRAARHRRVRAPAAPGGDRRAPRGLRRGRYGPAGAAAEAVAIFQDKVTAYEAVAGDRRSGAAVVAGAERRRTPRRRRGVGGGGHKACFKPASGAGGVGFRVDHARPLLARPAQRLPQPATCSSTWSLEAAAAGRGARRLAGHAAPGAAGGVRGLPHRARQPGPDGGGPHQERPPSGFTPARAVDRARARGSRRASGCTT